MEMEQVRAACRNFGTGLYSFSQLHALTGGSKKDLRARMRKLTVTGEVTLMASYEVEPYKKGRPSKEYKYRNTKKLAPAPLTAPVDKQNGWDKMWRAARALRRFTRDDLVKICTQDINNVKFFTRYYRKLGYMQPSKDCGRPVIWTLIKDPGPARPIGGHHVD